MFDSLSYELKLVPANEKRKMRTRTHMRSFSCHAVTTGMIPSSLSSLNTLLHASALSLSLCRITGTCHDTPNPSTEWHDCLIHPFQERQLHRQFISPALLLKQMFGRHDNDDDERVRFPHLLPVVLGHGEHGSHLRANKSGCKNHVHGKLANPFAGFDGLVHSLLRQRDVHTTREQVLGVPQRLAMADQNQRTLLCHNPTSKYQKPRKKQKKHSHQLAITNNIQKTMM